MYSFEADLDVVKVEMEGGGVARLFLGSNAVVEVPSKFAAGGVGKKIHLKISEERDEPSNWSVYMWGGVVYASGKNSYRISAGGFIVGLDNVDKPPQVGTKLYIGIKY